ncbi:MAG: hypothetical protein PHR94_08470 [Methylomonas lenta]|nr:hypothetical protein [Methylomonas lenta]
MKDQQIAVLTHRKCRSDAWPETEFHEHRLSLPMGGETRVKLAERGVCLKT